MRRRHFLQTTALASAGTIVAGCQSPAPRPRRISANERLNIGIIGTAHRAAEDMRSVATENIVALCDTDENLLAEAKTRYPAARAYNDFRKLLEQPNIDAVVIGTADHTHAVVTSAALRLGKHVYCEKPLTHTVYEARTIAGLAAGHKTLATQMGTQIHAAENYRRTVELVQSGAIGKVHECHVWCVKGLANSERPTSMPPTPPRLHWDLWLGPAPSRPYHPDYLPKTWRHWWDFGEGILGDMACHYVDLVFWALDLRHPLTVEAEGPPVHPETTPEWLIVRYEFPARHELPPVKLTWYDGGKRPTLVQEGKAPDWPDAVLFVGDKGMVIADYKRRLLLPEPAFKDFTPPTPFIPDLPGPHPHHQEWIHACKTGAPTSCNFAYAAALTETVLLGNVAYRTGHKLDWNAVKLEVKNSAQAANYICTDYRKGWEI